MTYIRIFIAAGLAVLFSFRIAPAGDKKTITRLEDPVVVLGNQLKDFIGASPNKLALMTYSAEGFSPIPFQIDQRHTDGMYAFRYGAEARSDADPNLDSNDELVFMINNAGDKAPVKFFPPGAVRGIEIEMVDPLDGKNGWVYLLQYQDTPPRSAIDYVVLELDEKKGRKRAYSTNTSGSGVIVGAPIDTVSVDELRFVSQNGSVSADFLDRMKLRGEMRLKFLPFTLDFKVDQLIREDIKAWIDGPVRGIYYGTGYFDFTLVKLTGKGYEEFTFYRNSLNTHMVFLLPFKISTFLRKFTIRGYLDFNKSGYGIKVFSEVNPPELNIVLDGSTSPEEKSIDFKSNCDWIVGYNSLGGIIFRMFPPTGGDWDHVSMRLFLHEDLDAKVEPEDDPGELAVGTVLDGFEKVHLQKGVSDGACYFVENFHVGDEKPIINILDHPVRVTCSKM